MSLTTPYREQFLEADGITITFPFDDHGDGFDAISKNYVKCEIYNADGSVIVPDFTVDLSAKTITITSLTTPDGQVLNAPQNGAIVRIYRDVPEAQNTTAQALQSSTAQQIVQNFDNIVAMIQELQYANEHFTLRSTLPQRDLQIDLLRDIDDQKLVYWDNEKRKLVVTNYKQDELLLPADKEDILAQANAYSDEQNAVLESRINGKFTAVDAQIDANADAIQKTREDFINADSEIHQILNSHANELTTLRGNQASLGDQVSGIEEKIPESASGTNHLVTKQMLLDEEMDIRDDLNEIASELQTQITAQAAEIATKQDQLVAGDNIVISGNTISATGTGGVGVDMQVVDQLPAIGKKGVIYLVPKDGAAPDVHDEYVWIDATQTFELIGTTQVDLTGYVKNTDYATKDTYGVVRVNTSGQYGIGMNESVGLYLASATDSQVEAKANSNKAITPKVLDLAVKTGVTTNTIALTDEEKAAAQAWLGVSGGGASGLESVATDRTLKGDGRSDDPLGLSSETIDRFEEIEKVIPGHASEDDKLCTYSEMLDTFQVVSDELTGLSESIQTKDLTVGTSEGTLNLSITAGVATIATNNGLDIVAQTKFDTAPTTDDDTTYANALDTSLVRKAQVATAIADAMANVDALPDQTGNAEKVLTTDGTNASWTEMPGLIIRRL